MQLRCDELPSCLGTRFPRPMTQTFFKSLTAIALLSLGMFVGAADFNYPEPPHEGRAGFFPIAENGQAKCVIVREAKSRAAAELLKAYLELSTGATFAVVDDGKPVAEGMAAIHVGN